MKKTFIFLLLVIAILLCFTACSTKKLSGEEEVQKTIDGKSGIEEIDWPKKAVNIICPYSAGGDTDIYARTVANYLSKEMGKSFVVINMTGGSGVIAAKHLMAQEPDGYNILFNNTAYISQEVTAVADFSFAEDFDVLGTVARDQTYVLVCRKGSKFDSLEELVKYAKNNPGKVSIGSSFGQASHITAVQVEKALGIEFNKLDVGSSAADRVAAFVGGQIDMLTSNYISIEDYVENGDFIALGLMANERNSDLPNIPTFIEQGYEVVYNKLYELRFPKGTDEKIINKMSFALKEMVDDIEFINTVKKYYAQPYYLDAESTLKEDAEERINIEKLIEG